MADTKKQDDFGFEPVVDDEIGFVPMDMGFEPDGMPASDIPQSESFRMGSEQGLTFGSADELGGAIGAGLEASQVPASEGKSKADQLSSLYKEYRDANRKRYKAAEEANPKTSFAGNVAGGFLVPGGMLGEIPKDASLLAKMGHGAVIGTRGGALTGAGMSEADTPMGVIEDAERGAGLGLGLGVAMPAAAKGVELGAEGLGALKNIVAKPFKIGQKYGKKGELLLGSDADQRVQKEITEYGKDVPKKFVNELNSLAQQKQELVEIAQAQGVQIDEAAVDTYLQKHLGQDLETNLPAVRREMEQFKEILRTAKEGPLVDKVKEVFVPRASKTQIGQFQEQFEKIKAQQKLTQPDEVIMGGEVGANTPQTNPQIQKFEEKFEKLKSEQRNFPGQMEQHPLELVYEPTDVADQVHAIIKQPQYDAQGSFTGYKKVASEIIKPPGRTAEPELIFEPTEMPDKVYGIIRQAQYDSNGKLTGYKKISDKLLNVEDAAELRQISEKTRAGGKNLQNPQEMMQLYRDLKQTADMSQSQQVQKAAQSAHKEAQGLFRDAIPGAGPIDQKISTIKTSAEQLGMPDTQKLNPIVHATEVQNAMKTITNTINSLESGGGTGGKARQVVEDALANLEKVAPEMAAQMRSKMTELGEKAYISKTVANTYLPRPLATPKSWSMVAGNVTGYIQHKLAKQSPEELTKLAETFTQMRNSQVAQSLGDKLKRAASLPDKSGRAKNAALFGVMQDPAYRQLLKEKVGDGSEEAE